jgi:hypothetical protein
MQQLMGLGICYSFTYIHKQNLPFNFLHVYFEKYTFKKCVNGNMLISNKHVHGHKNMRFLYLFQDRKLLLALMEVIAKPQIYFQYANVTDTIMPPAFIKFLTKKVMRFFST